MKLLKRYRTILLISLALALSACRGRPFHKPPVLPEQNMFNQAKFQSQQENKFFPDKRSMRMPVKGTIARGWLKTNTVYWDGKTKDGKWVKKNPLPITEKLVNQGRKNFNIYCTPCHSRLGNGDGIVVKYGFVHPPSFHSKQLRNVSDGFLYNVVTNGFAVMKGYRDQIPVHNRWAIVSYIRALQLSQHATKADLQGHTFSQSEIKAYKDSLQAKKEAEQKEAQAQAQQQPTQLSHSQLVALGKKLFNQKTCSSCHSINGSKGVGPTLKDLYGSTVTLSNGKTVNANADYIKESIMKPHAQIVKGFQPIMPTGLISKQKNLDALTAYIESISSKKAPKETAQAQQTSQNNQSNQSQLIALGKKLYTQKTCSSCHSLNGSRGVGPTWKGLFGSKVTLKSGKTVTADASYIRESILKPNAQVVKGFQPIMPSGLVNKKHDVDALVAFIKSVGSNKSANSGSSKQSQSKATNQQSGQMSQAQLISRGKKLFNEKTCSSCHSTNGSRGVGPTFKGLFGSNVTLKNGKTVKADASYIKESIMKPHAQIVKGFQPIMPTGLISKKQNVDALVAFIKSLK